MQSDIDSLNVKIERRAYEYDEAMRKLKHEKNRTLTPKEPFRQQHFGIEVNSKIRMTFYMHEHLTYDFPSGEEPLGLVLELKNGSIVLKGVRNDSIASQYKGLVNAPAKSLVLSNANDWAGNTIPVNSITNFYYSIQSVRDQGKNVQLTFKSSRF